MQISTPLFSASGPAGAGGEKQEAIEKATRTKARSREEKAPEALSGVAPVVVCNTGGREEASRASWAADHLGKWEGATLLPRGDAGGGEPSVGSLLWRGMPSSVGPESTEPRGTKSKKHSTRGALGGPPLPLRPLGQRKPGSARHHGLGGKAAG